MKCLFNVINKFSTNILLVNTKFEYAFENAFFFWFFCINVYFTKIGKNEIKHVSIYIIRHFYDNYYWNINSNLL